MKKSLHLNIPTPCHENWQNMTPKQQGRFCQSCQKTVVDFTNMSDAAILNYFKNANGRVCGRLNKNQLEKTYPVPSTNAGTKWLKAGFLASGLLAASVSQGQEHTLLGKIAIEQPLETKQEEKKETIPESSENTFESITIKGKVVDEENEPLIGVTILIADTNMGTVTDIDGTYILNIPSDILHHPSWELRISYLGYATENIIISAKTIQQEAKNSKPIVHNKDIVLETEVTVLLEMATTGLVIYNYEQTLWQITKRWVHRLMYNFRQNRQAKKQRKAEQKTAALVDEVTTTTPEIKPVEKIAIPKNLHTFPNPFSETLHFEYKTEKTENIYVKIVDENGHLVWEGKYTLEAGNHPIEISPNLVSGHYWLYVEKEDGSREVEQIVCLQRG